MEGAGDAAPDRGCPSARLPGHRHGRQPARHYDEAAVGRAIAAAVENHGPAREDLFLQTKFTFQPAQDHRLPYDPQAPIGVQVEQSLASSLEHLGTRVIDSFLLHGPAQRSGLATADWEAWRAMEAIQESGRAVCSASAMSPSIRSRASVARLAYGPHSSRTVLRREGWDRDVRQFCSSNGLVYQGFSLLTANRKVMADPELARIARRHGRTVSQIVFRFALDLGMVVLTGTTDAGHMRADLEVSDFRLDPEEVERIERLAT